MSLGNEKIPNCFFQARAYLADDRSMKIIFFSVTSHFFRPLDTFLSRVEEGEPLKFFGGVTRRKLFLRFFSSFELHCYNREYKNW